MRARDRWRSSSAATRRGAHDGARPTAALVARLVERMREDTDQRVVDAAGRALFFAVRPGPGAFEL